MKSICTPHEWQPILDEARRLCMRINCEARLSVRDLREQHRDLADEATAISALAGTEERELTDAEDHRYWQIMDEDKGELIKLEASIGKAQSLLDAQKRLAVAHDAAHLSSYFGQPIEDLSGGDGTRQGMKLKTSGGQTIQALTSKESLFAKAQARAGVGAGGDDSDHFGSAEAAQNAFGESILSLVSGRPSGVRNVFTGGDDRGGLLMGDSLSSAVMDLARSASVCFRANAQTLDMQTPEVSIASVTQDPTAHWRAELQPVPSTDVAFGRHTLRAKSLACVVPISLEFAEDVANGASMVTQTVAASIALAIDRAILFGKGAANEPLGITNTPGVNSIADIDLPSDYGDVTQGIRKIYGANFAGEPSDLAWVMNPREAATYDSLIDSTAQPLRPTPWAGALQKYPTTSLPVNLGDASDESEMIIGDFTNILVGVRTNLNARILDAGRVSSESGVSIDAASQLAKLLVVYVRLDVALVRPSWMTVLSGVKAS